MFNLLRSLVVLVLVIGGIYFIVTNSSTIQSEAFKFLHINDPSLKPNGSVKGKQIYSELTHDLQPGIDWAGKQFSHMSLGEVMSLFSQKKEMATEMHNASTNLM